MYFIEGILRLSDLFNGVSDEQLSKLAPFCREEIYEAGTLIFRAGTPSHTIYVVSSGSVALEMDLQIGRGKGTATIGTVTRGGCASCSGLISPYMHTTTGRALEKTDLIALDTRILKRLFEEKPEVGERVMANLAKVIFSRLEHTEATLGHILAVVFHDIKAPLAAVESVNRLILGGFCGDLDEEQKNMLEGSSKGVTALLELLNSIASISRIGIRDTVVSRISPGQVTRDAVEEMRPLADEKKLELRVKTPKKLPTISADGAQLRQLMINLLSNAIKFTPAHGAVTVKIDNDEADIRLEVLDNGAGIPAKELPKIFDEFYRGLDLTERGAGLGLSIARRIVEGHRGKIWVVSPCPGSDKGSQFVVTLPKGAGLPDEKALIEASIRSEGSKK